MTKAYYNIATYMIFKYKYYSTKYKDRVGSRYVYVYTTVQHNINNEPLPQECTVYVLLTCGAAQSELDPDDLYLTKNISNP